MSREWEKDFERKYLTGELEMDVLHSGGGVPLKAIKDFIKGVEDRAKGVPLTPEQVEELKEKDYPQLSVTKVMVAGDLFDYGKKIGKNEAISHINANYWLIPKKEGEVNAD